LHRWRVNETHPLAIPFEIVTLYCSPDFTPSSRFLWAFPLANIDVALGLFGLGMGLLVILILLYLAVEEIFKNEDD